MKKIRVLEAVNQLGLGGTEYTLQLFANFLDKRYFEVTVLSLLEGGDREQILKDLGIEVFVLNGDFSRLPALLDNTDVLHWHGGGAMDSDLFQVIQTHKPSLVIQTNVFGIYDASPLYNFVDYDLYVSNMILVRRMEQDSKLEDNFSYKRKVLPNPIDIDRINQMMPTDLQVSEFKKKMGLDSHFIVGRIGRADNYKFDMITLSGFAKFARKVPEARFLLIGATPEMIAHAASLGIQDKLVIQENTINFQDLLIYYKSMDVFLAISQIGESFGMVIAEAMTVGTPVVTASTENRDNAQIELVDHGKSGIVVKHSRTAISRALQRLYRNPDLRQQLAVESKLKVAAAYKAQSIVASLEQLILTHFNLPIDRYEGKTLMRSFSKEMVNDYRKRCINLFGRSSVSKFLIWQYKKLF